MKNYENILKIQNINFTWPQNVKPLFSDLSLDICKGVITCILGPSGCGKTSMLNLAGGFILPDSGRITFNGAVVNRPEKSRVMVFQDYSQLFPWKTVLKNVTFPMEKKDKNLALKLLELSGLKGVENLYPAALSGGMKQRVAIARALAARPELLLLDEPFDGLDAPTRRALQNTLLNLEGETATSIMMVTHDIDEAVYLSDRLLVMSAGGKIIFHDENPLPHPRESGKEEFLRFKSEIYSLIEGERTS
ncbi:MAG: ABC transporter ATP-binding protein [Spirochaetales bacterium]|nr:ABC transporter ATP-binding protein [Spirochaetales bacterium]